MQGPGVRRGIDFAEVNRIIRSLAMYSSEAAEEAQSAIDTEVSLLRDKVSHTLAGCIDAVLEYKDLNLEDEDSSIDVHMLMRLKKAAQELRS
jgi:hypothetical protein